MKILIGLAIAFLFFVIIGQNSGPSYSSTPGTTTTSSSYTPSSKPRAPTYTDNWNTHDSADEMTGEKSSYINSDEVVPNRKLDFPYSDLKSSIGIGCDSGSQWVYLWFSKTPNMVGDTTKDGYNLVKLRVKFDNKLDTATMTQSWGAKALHFQYDSWAVKKMLQANTLTVEIPWYGRNAVFTYKTAMLKEALSASTLCK